MKSDLPLRMFKGWTKPGPDFSDKTSEPFSPESDETLDYLSGMSRIFQLKEGHRFSTDDLLVAWYGSLGCPHPSQILDLGSGLGTVALVLAFKNPGAKITTVEAQDRSVELQKKSIELNGYQNRFSVFHSDFRSWDAGQSRFDLITGSPPYWPETDGVVSEHPQKRACRFEVRGGVEDYCQTASRWLSHGGVFACVFPITPEHQLKRVFQGASDAGLHILRYRPVVFKKPEEPLLGVFLMGKKSDYPQTFLQRGAWVEPELIIREADGSISHEYTLVKYSIGIG